LTKEELRQEALRRRDALAPAEIEAKSARIAARVLALPAYAAADWVLLFASFRSEVNTWPMMRRVLADRKRLVLPRVDVVERNLLLYEVRDPDRDFEPRWRSGLREPRPGLCRRVPESQIDLIIAPGVAFDARGERLGYGAGYYDNFLRALRPSSAGVLVVGVAFELQLVPAVPNHDHDERVDMIVTESRIIDCRSDASLSASA
jgi:5-formyltetrahydrofolate cyclo-ligase